MVGPKQLTKADILKRLERYAPRKEILKVAGDDTQAIAICLKLRSYYINFNPATNPSGHKFFDGFADVVVQDRTKHAEYCYKEKEPLRLLEDAGIKGKDIVRLHEEICRGQIAFTYETLALDMTAVLLGLPEPRR
ncbi:MAG TPA: hypothetical protein VL945_00660 [Candidatus Saccharimonadales bacterium]|nr:hypothetical protein [Candidatus Saccharimonadales bacterium]